jgi:hypothetical protein
MAVSSANSAGSKTRRALSLTSGTSWTVPAGVNYVNVTLMGGSGAGQTGSDSIGDGKPGQLITSTLSTTPGATITYAIGAGGTPSSGAGGTTTFTGATSAGGGGGGGSAAAATGASSYNIGGTSGRNPGGQNVTGGTGGAGRIDVEYWV